MPVKWFLILLMTAMIVTPISLIIDQGYMDAAGGVAGTGEDSIMNMLMGGIQNSKADFNVGTIWTVLTGPNFGRGLWKVISADYSFFKTQGTVDSAQSDSIIWWFRATFWLMNFVIFLAIALAIVSALISSAVK
jgi:hypothetical protein